MNSLPLISHRMFLAAMGQKYPRPQPPRPDQNHNLSRRPQTRWDAVPHFSPRREARSLVAALVPSSF